jgi:tetratricopeptide (TPR) repeat protein
VRGLDREGKDARLLESIVARSCRDDEVGRYLNVAAIDPNFRGDWLAPEPANYVATRDQAGRAPKAPCDYAYLGGGFFGSEASKAWDLLIAQRVRYVITLDPGMYSVPVNVINEALRPENFQILWTNLNHSGFFTREAPLSEDPGITVFRRLDHLGNGRALSDQGKHEQAIDELSKATVLEPTNVEVWANLALAYERRASFEEAVAAGMRARSLNANHYYVNLGLARALVQLKQWAEAVARAEDAAAKAPAVLEQMHALTIAAEASFQSGNSLKGCSFLRKLTRNLQDELASHGCER